MISALRGSVGALGMAALVAGASGCASRRPAAVPTLTHAVPETGAIDASVFFIGDAGHGDSRAVVGALGREARGAPAGSMVVFLGDNVYERGVPRRTDPGYTTAAALLRDQLDSLPPNVPAVYVPGNHDWDRQGPDGLNAIRREDDVVRSVDSARFALLPHGGCPGPVARDVGTRLRLLAIDTQWWLQRYARTDSRSRCDTRDSATVVTALGAALAQAARDRRQVIVIGHHPLVSGGPHGGHAGDGNPVRRLLRLDQDVSNGGYRRLIGALEAVFANAPEAPLMYASGHDHTLQVLHGRGARYFVVSGGGSAHNLDGADSLASTLFALGQHSGFMRLDAAAGGRWLLRVYVAERGVARVVWWGWLDDGAQPGAR